MPRSRKSVERAASCSVGLRERSGLLELGGEPLLLATHAGHVLEEPERHPIPPAGASRVHAEALEEGAGQEEALVRAGSQERRHEVRKPPLEPGRHFFRRVAAEHLEGQPGGLRERGAEEELVDDRVGLALDEPLANGAVGPANPVGPRQGEAVLREAGEPRGKRLPHRQENGPRLLVRRERRRRRRGGGREGEGGTSQLGRGQGQGRPPGPAQRAPAGPSPRELLSGPRRCPGRTRPSGPPRGRARTAGAPRPSGPAATAACRG